MNSESTDADGRLHQEAIAWVARLSDPGATAEDRQVFEQWRAENPAHAHAYDKVARVWQEPALDEAAAQIARRAPSGVRNPREKRLVGWAVAACLAALLVGGLSLDLPTRLQADYHTAVGERRTIHLPDRSSVTLNTKTALAVAFDGEARRVRILKGEAFFKVERDLNRPFLVESEETVTRAVGTAFVVRHESNTDRVTVVEGTVEVRARQASAAVQQLTAGMMITAEAGRVEPPQSVDPSVVSAWLNGLLIVDGAPLTRVLDEIRRYHPGAILVMNRRLNEMRVTGTYKLDDPSAVLYHLTKTFPIQTVALGDRVIVLF
jgi:transmembrane sensor